MNKDKANQYKAYFRSLLNDKGHKYKQWCSEEDYAFRYNRSRGIGNMSIKTTVEIFKSLGLGNFYYAAVSVTAHRKTYIEKDNILSDTQDLVRRIYFNDEIPSLDDFENEIIDLLKKIGWL